MIIQPQQKMDLLKCQISVAATCMGAEPPIIAIQDIFSGAIQQGIIQCPVECSRFTIQFKLLSSPQFKEMNVQILNSIYSTDCVTAVGYGLGQLLSVDWSPVVILPCCPTLPWPCSMDPPSGEPRLSTRVCQDTIMYMVGSSIVVS